MKSGCLFLLVALAPAMALGDLLVSPAASYGGAVADNIKAECELPRAQSEAVLKQLAEAGLPARAAASEEIPATGRFLDLRIEAAISGGNAFIGHRKHVTTSARLYEDGKEVAQTTLSRDSSGGFGGGYKGSCSVLRRCTNTLGKDIAAWVKSQPAKAAPARQAP
jgi:hypothetical protein